MVPEFLPQLIALIAALTVGIPTADLEQLPNNFANSAVQEVTSPIRQNLDRLEAAGAIPPATAAALRQQVSDASVVSRAVIAAVVRTPITIHAVPQLIHEDLTEGKTLSRALGEAGRDVTSAVRQGNAEIVAALQEVRHSQAQLSGRDSSATQAQVAKVTVRGWDPKAVRAAIKQERSELRTAVAAERTKARAAVKKAREAIRSAVRKDRAAESEA